MPGFVTWCPEIQYESMAANFMCDARIRLCDIFVFHNGHHVRLVPQYHVLVSRPEMLRSRPCRQGGGSRSRQSWLQKECHGANRRGCQRKKKKIEHGRLFGRVSREVPEATLLSFVCRTTRLSRFLRFRPDAGKLVGHDKII